MSRRDLPTAGQRIAVVGPSADARGGVAGVLHAIGRSSLSRRVALVPVVTHCDGGAAAKLLQTLRGLGSLALLCSRRRVDLVHVHSSSRASFPRKAIAVAIARAARRPVVLHLHGSGFEILAGGGGPAGRLKRIVFGVVARRVDAVVTASPALARALAGAMRLRDVRVVPNAAEASGGPADTPSGGHRSVLFLGRLERRKGVFELVDAFAVARVGRPDLRLVMAGSGSAEAELRAAVAAKGLTGVVTLPGWVRGDEKTRLLASASCLALPSHGEGVPLAVLEAMLSGVPVVASRVGGIPEVARSERDALLVEPGDVEGLALALERVVDDVELAGRLARAARERAEREFALERVADALAALYASVLGRAAAAGSSRSMRPQGEMPGPAAVQRSGR